MYSYLNALNLDYKKKFRMFLIVWICLSNKHIKATLWSEWEKASNCDILLQIKFCYLFLHQWKWNSLCNIWVSISSAFLSFYSIVELWVCKGWRIISYKLYYIFISIQEETAMWLLLQTLYEVSMKDHKHFVYI